MRTIFISILIGYTSYEVYQAITAGIKWNSYPDKPITNLFIPCPDKEIVIQYVDRNPLNSRNIDSFMEAYGFTRDNMNQQHPKKKDPKVIKQDTMIEPKKIAPTGPKMIRIKVTKSK